MKIKKIDITNFRSIPQASFEPNKFNIFVGQNNHGKTNLFEAIEWFYTGKGDLQQIRRRGVAEEICVEIIYEDAKDGLEKMANDTAKTKLEPYIDATDCLKVRRLTDKGASKKFEIFSPTTSEFEKLPSGIDNSLLDLLPKFEYVKTETALKDVAKYGATTPMGSMLSGVLSALLEDNPRYVEFKQTFEKLFGADDSEVKMELDIISRSVKGYLVKQFPECAEVEFNVKEPLFEDLLKNFETKIDDGVMTDASEKGDGMQRAIMLAIIQAYADFRKEKEGKIKNFSFFIDEGELHLHPTAQRKLKEALTDLSQRGDQIFLNTHSAVLVADDNEEQNIYTVIKELTNTNIELVAKEDKKYIIYDLLGGSPSDLLLPRNFLIVEGKSELLFLNEINNRFYKYKNLQIIDAVGDIDQASETINGLYKVYKPLEHSLYKDNVVIVLDYPSAEKISEGALKAFKEAHPNLVQDTNLHLIPVGNLEEYYPEARQDQITHNGQSIVKWKRTHEEASAMNSTQKQKLAKAVGAKIDQNQFETEMLVMFNALKKCNELAFE